MYRILSVGMDNSLLSTRGLVLQQTGAVVKNAAPEAGLLLLESCHCDLLVLCHSLTDHHVSQLCTTSKSCSQPVRTLLIEAPGSTSRARCHGESRFLLDDGPAALVKMVGALLQVPQADSVQRPAAKPRVLPFHLARPSGAARGSGPATVSLWRAPESQVLRAKRK